MSGGHVFAVAGAKGGVGKTTTCLNLATALAERGRSVLVVEADIAMANAVDFLDLDFDPRDDPSLHDVLRGAADPGEAIYDAPGGFDLLPSGVALAGFAAAHTGALPGVVDRVRSDYDVTILDTGAGLSRETLYPLGIADEVLVVSTPRVASVRDAKKTIELTERVDGEVAGAVFVTAGTGTAPPVERIARFLSVDLLGHVPPDEAVPASQDAGRPVVSADPDSPAAIAYRRLARRLDPDLFGVPAPAAGEGVDAGDGRTAKSDGGRAIVPSSDDEFDFEPAADRSPRPDRAASDTGRGDASPERSGDPPEPAEGDATETTGGDPPETSEGGVPGPGDGATSEPGDGHAPPGDRGTRDDRATTGDGAVGEGNSTGDGRSGSPAEETGGDARSGRFRRLLELLPF